jgi:ATP-dependent Lon protease
MLKLPDGTVKVLVEGGSARASSRSTSARHVHRQVMPLPATSADARGRGDAPAIIAQFDQYVKLNKKIPPEI